MILLIQRAWIALVAVVLAAAPVLAQQPQAAQSEFVPVTGPVTEQLPAAPLVIAAYAFVWLAVLFFVWSVWRRLGRVDAEMQALARRESERSRAR